MKIPQFLVQQSVAPKQSFSRLFTLFVLFLIPVSTLIGQAPSSILPDIVNFKLEYPLDDDGDDYNGVSYGDRDDPHIKNAIEGSLGGYTAPLPFRNYFYVSGNEVVFRAHCAGALTSVNAYPRCELRERPGGTDSFWSFSNEQELNATFRVTNLPNLKKEVCMLQIKGNTSNSTSNTKEVFRLEYREGSQGLHRVKNESSTSNNIMDYSLGQTIEARLYVNNGDVTIELTNTSNGDTYNETYESDYAYGYFKAGCYTQSSIWEEKNGVGDESPNAYGEVRFSELTLGNATASCTPLIPGNRVATNVGTNSATLNWNYNSNMDHYNARYRPVGSSNWSYKYSLNSGSVNITGLSNNTQYQWQVRAKCPDQSATSYNSGAGANFTTGSNNSGSDIVIMRKRNAMGYALDGQGGGSNNQNVHVWGYNPNNNNQKWIEIDRGGGFYTYQKYNTNYCLDGGNGGASSQNVKIWSCSTNNQNQHWKKISMGSGAYRLQKRNSSGYSVDGQGGGSDGQNVHLWANNNNNQNQHWVFEVVGSTASRVGPVNNEIVLPQISSFDKIRTYPNPFTSELNIVIPNGEVEEGTSVRMIDVLGRVIYEQREVQAGDQLQVSKDLEAGMYILQWLDKDNQLLQIEKLIKR